MLAELMLPDQVHNREEDWTIFFLHKGPDEGEPDGEAGLMYVLSLVNKKLDQTVKRYAKIQIRLIEGEPSSKQLRFARGIHSYIFTR
jgi:hypothetical protein